MANLLDIKKAKEIGRNIRRVREAQHLNLRALAAITNFSINQIVSLESGNYFAFHESLDEFYQSAARCLEALGTDQTKLLEETSVWVHKENTEVSIPYFLQKSA